MALFYERMQSRARKVIDTADTVRDGMLQQLSIVTQGDSEEVISG
ncbi:MAG: hypothetical protein WA232_10705 [Candidatus Sulfotelmatobacter sp.]